MAFNGKRPRVGISYYDFWVVPIGTLHALKEFFMNLFSPVAQYTEFFRLEVALTLRNTIFGYYFLGC